MEGIGGILTVLVAVGIGVASIIEERKKAAHKTVSPTSGKFGRSIGSGGLGGVDGSIWSGGSDGSVGPSGSGGFGEPVGPAEELTWREILSGVPHRDVSSRKVPAANFPDPNTLSESYSLETQSVSHEIYNAETAGYDVETSPRRAIFATMAASTPSPTPDSRVGSGASSGTGSGANLKSNFSAGSGFGTDARFGADAADLLSSIENVDNQQVTFDAARDFDLRRAVIESEILTPKYF